MVYLLMFLYSACFRLFFLFLPRPPPPSPLSPYTTLFRSHLPQRHRGALAALAGRPRDHRHDRTSVDRSHPGRPAVLAHRAPAVDPWLTSRAPAATRRPNLLGPPIPRPNHLSARRSLGPTAHPPHHPSARRSTIQRSLDRRPAPPGSHPTAASAAPPRDAPSHRHEGVTDDQQQAAQPPVRQDRRARPLDQRSEEHTSELQSRGHLVCR